MDQREILFGRRITRLRREVAELATEVQTLASLHTYSPAMDQFDIAATVRDLTYAAEAARVILTKLGTTGGAK